VTVVDEFAVKHGGAALAELDRIVDFGSGWGRIARTLLTKAAPTKLHALDVDNERTALVNITLPGVNALTVSPEPPTVLGSDSIDGAVAFSVFSHLSGRRTSRGRPNWAAWCVRGSRGDHGAGRGLSSTWLPSRRPPCRATGRVSPRTWRRPFPISNRLNRATISVSCNARQAVAAASALTTTTVGRAPGLHRTGLGAAGFQVVEWVPSGVVSQATGVHASL
jgi:hypothetical protein